MHSDTISSIRSRMKSVAGAVKSLIDLNLLPSFDSEITGTLAIEKGIDNTNTLSLCTDCSEDRKIYADAHFTLKGDSYTCHIEVFDCLEQEEGTFVHPELLEHLRNHPTIGYKHNDEGANSYLYIEVPPTQIVIAYLAVLMAVEEFVDKN